MLILNKNHPSISLYYLGSKIAEFMKLSSQEDFHLTELYILFDIYTPITFNRFMLTLDWLQMVGLIRSNSKGKIYYVPKGTDN